MRMLKITTSLFIIEFSYLKANLEPRNNLKINRSATPKNRLREKIS